MVAEHNSLNILGTRIAAVGPAAALERIGAWLRQPAFGRYVCCTGVHGVMEGIRHPSVRDAHNRAAACVPDGMPLVWLGRLQGHRDMARVYGPDLMLAVLEAGIPHGWTHYFYGGKPGVAQELASCLQTRLPGLKVLGADCPPFRPLTAEERSQTLAAIGEKRPDVVWIGLSTPKQELLMADWAPDIRASLMVGVGAAFDFHTGRLRQAPRWMQRAGLEWFFRLCMEPRRLWKRYFTNNPLFVYHCALQLGGIRKYPVEVEGGHRNVDGA